MSDSDREVPPRSSETGEFVKARDPADVLAAMEPYEPYVTSELAEQLDWPRRTVYEALTELHETDRIEKKQKNARVVMWIRPGDES